MGTLTVLPLPFRRVELDSGCEDVNSKAEPSLRVIGCLFGIDFAVVLTHKPASTGYLHVGNLL